MIANSIPCILVKRPGTERRIRVGVEVGDRKRSGPSLQLLMHLTRHHSKIGLGLRRIASAYYPGLGLGLHGRHVEIVLNVGLKTNAIDGNPSASHPFHQLQHAIGLRALAMPVQGLSRMVHEHVCDGAQTQFR